MIHNNNKNNQGVFLELLNAAKKKMAKTERNWCWWTEFDGVKQIGRLVWGEKIHWWKIGALGRHSKGMNDQTQYNEVRPFVNNIYFQTHRNLT